MSDVANVAPEPDEIEITPEMIEAGIGAFCKRLADEDYSDVVSAVYAAMEGVRKETLDRAQRS